MVTLISMRDFKAVNIPYYIASLQDALNLTSVLIILSGKTFRAVVADMSVIALPR